jgi:hypothetical protein
VKLPHAFRAARDSVIGWGDSCIGSLSGRPLSGVFFQMGEEVIQLKEKAFDTA